jgi:threonine/homoserine/homoserine lactone efflux protein
MEGTIALFLVTVISLIIVPGPDMLYVTSRALAAGREAGIKAAMGISAGYLVFTLLVAVGLEQVVSEHPNFLLAFKLTGMVYLLYLAYQLFVADIMSFSAKPKHGVQSFNDIKYGFLTSVLNPKGLIFYFSLLPLFYMPELMPFWVYALLFGSITSLLCFIVYSLVGVFAAGKGHELLMSHRNGKIISKFASLSIFIVALTLIISDIKIFD